jgi:predicted regulator of Ras-like GTPase activity (Roadblock/LC7/MglB family)
MTAKVRQIKGLSLVDHDGLPLVSTLGPGSREESLAAFGGAMTVQMDRVQRDFEMGPLYQANIVGRDLQLFVTPVKTDATLVAVVDNPATSATITMHLLALARDVMPLLGKPEVAESSQSEETTEQDS